MATTKNVFTSVSNAIRKALGLDAGVGPVGVVISALLCIFGAVLFFLLLFNSFGIGNAIFASGAYHGSRGVGIVFLCVLAFWAWLNFSDRVPFKVSDMAFILSLVIGFILLILYNSGNLF